MLLGKVKHLRIAVDAGTRLERTGFVVESRVYYPAVAAGLVGCQGGLLLQEHDLGLGMGHSKLIVERGADYAATNKHKIKMFHCALRLLHDLNDSAR